MDKLRDIGRGTRMIKIGITGGVGSGKSQVLAYLEEIHHARICQADLIAHELQRPKEKCWRKIREYFLTYSSCFEIDGSFLSPA